MWNSQFTSIACRPNHHQEFNEFPFKQSVEEALGKKVSSSISKCFRRRPSKCDPLCAVRLKTGISDNVGWSPDYQDPSTYMDILKASSGENTKTFLGFDPSENNEAIKSWFVRLWKDDQRYWWGNTRRQQTLWNMRQRKLGWPDSACVTSSSTGRPFLTYQYQLHLHGLVVKRKDHVIYKGMKLQDKTGNCWLQQSPWKMAKEQASQTKSTRRS